MRDAVVLLVAFVALAEQFGLETILGAFRAGVVVSVVDRDTSSHPRFRIKLEAVGYDFLIPAVRGIRQSAGLFRQHVGQRVFAARRHGELMAPQRVAVLHDAVQHTRRMLFCPHPADRGQRRSA